MTDTRLDVLRKLVLGVAWVVMMDPLIRALTQLVLAWTSNATDPLAGVR